MSDEIEYCIEREDDRPYWYRVFVNDSCYSMHIRGSISISDGQITSIHENGCARKDFREAVRSFGAYRAFDKGREREVLKALEEKICGRGET